MIVDDQSCWTMEHDVQGFLHILACSLKRIFVFIIFLQGPCRLSGTLVLKPPRVPFLPVWADASTFSSGSPTWKPTLLSRISGQGHPLKLQVCLWCETQQLDSSPLQRCRCFQHISNIMFAHKQPIQQHGSPRRTAVGTSDVMHFRVMFHLFIMATQYTVSGTGAKGPG